MTATANSIQSPASSPLPASNVERAVLISVQFTKLGQQRKLRQDQYTVGSSEAEKKRTRAQKHILDCKEYDTIRTLDSQIRDYIESRALPSAVRKGIYLLPIALFDEVETRLVQYREQRERLVEELLDVYDAIIERDQAELADVFNRSDYPTKEEVRARFTLRWTYMTFGAASALEELSPVIAEQERRRWSEIFSRAEAYAEKTLTEGFQELLDNTVKRLNDTRDNGKPMIFRDTLVTKLADFLSVFRDRNITNNVQLQELAERAERILSNNEKGEVTPDRLRTDDSFRAAIGKQFAEVSKGLDQYLREKPKRRIVLDDGDD